MSSQKQAPIISKQNTVQEAAPYNPDTLLLHTGISLSAQHVRRFPKHVIRVLLILVGIAGTLWSFQGFTKLPVPFLPLALTAVIAAVVTRFLYRTPRFGLFLLLLETAALPFIIAKYSEEAGLGLKTVTKALSRAISHQPNVINTEMAGQFTEMQCVTFLFQIIIIMLVILLEFSEDSKLSFLLRFTVTFVFLEIGLFFGLETHPAAVLLLILFWIGSMTISTTGDPRPLFHRERKLESHKKHLHTVFQSHTGETEPLILAMVGVAAASGLLTGFLTKNYHRSEEMDLRRARLLDTISHYSFRDMTGLLGNVDVGFGPNIITDELDLNRTSELHFDGSTVMEIEMDSATVRDDYYLRGIVRTDYTGKGWAIDTANYREIRKLLQALSDANRTPQTLWHSDHADELRTDSGKFPVVHWSIHALRSEAVNYLPYQVLHPEGTRFLYDSEADLGSHQNYDYWVISNAKMNWQYFSNETAPSECAPVSEYEDYVYTHYLSIPDTAAMLRVRLRFEQQLAPLLKELSLKEQLEVIQSYIWERADYNTSPGSAPNGEDFVEYFLQESHKGFCAHYASAGVLLCRLAGIPARYVQGYVVTQEDIDKRGGAENFTVNLPDHRAHAWAEIYVRGFGWIPFEFTEGITSFWRQTGDPFGHNNNPADTTQPAATSTITTSRSTSLLTSTTTTATISGSSVSGASNNETPPKKLNLAPLLWTIAGITVLVLVFVVWKMIHNRIVAKRNAAMNQNRPYLAATTSYSFLLRLLRLCNLRQGNRLHGEFAELAESNCSLLEPGKISRAINIQQQAVFSREGVTAEEAAEIADTAQKLADQIYAHAGKLRRLILRWILHIVR